MFSICITSEKWLPYKSTNRPVIVQKLKPQPQPEAPKNIIIEYEKMNAVSVRTVLEEGVFRVDPNTYKNLIGTSLFQPRLHVSYSKLNNDK